MYAKKLTGGMVMKQVYSPGCVLLMYKPHLVQKVLAYLNEKLENQQEVHEHQICCQHEALLESGTEVVNTCPGCDRRFRESTGGISTRSLWEILADDESFPYPDYQQKVMTIHDACPTRSEDRVHTAIRKILDRMNIKLVEPAQSRKNSVCCGDSFYEKVPLEQVKDQMKKRAAGMPCDDVVVYCVSCVKSMHIGGKTPRYLVDLLFNESTEVGMYEPNEWHDAIDRFIETH
jgi:Fe-S oxidoreductase